MGWRYKPIGENTDQKPESTAYSSLFFQSVISIIRSLSWPRKFVIGILAVLNAMLSSLPHKTSMIPHPENGIWQLLSPQALDSIRLTREGSDRNLSPPGPFKLSFSSQYNILEPFSIGTESLVIRSLANITQTLLVLNNILPDVKDHQGSLVNGPSRNVCTSVLNCWVSTITVMQYTLATPHMLFSGERNPNSCIRRAN